MALLNPHFSGLLHPNSALSLHQPHLRFDESLVAGMELFTDGVFEFGDVDVLDCAYDIPEVGLDF